MKIIAICVFTLLVACHAKYIEKVKRADSDDPVFGTDGKLAEITVKKMLSETNRYRLMHDATPLGYCPVCADAAQKHADDIANTGVVKPDGKAKYGQIIFSTSDANDVKNGNYFGTLVPAKIYDQIKNYDYVKSEFKDNAADFSQLIWEGSEVAGFAGKKATDGTVYVVMYFNPPGNNETMSFYENVNRVTGAGDAECGHVKCDDGWTLHGCSCFKFFEDELSWPDAVDHCNILKASLASAESMEEGTLLRTMMMEKEKQAWVGMSDTANKGGFQFVDGTPYVYSDWSFESYEWLYAHPNDARSKCITSSKDGWNYKECSDKLPSICRSRPNGVMSFALDLYFPGSQFTNELAMPGTQRYNTMKNTIDKAFNDSYGGDIWYVGSTFYQFMPRDNGEVAASTMLRFAPDIRAPVDPITKLRDILRKQTDVKILAVRLIPGIGRVSAVSVTGGTCPSGCSGDCYPECNPVCCGAAVSLSAPAIPSGFTACPQFPGCGTPCQSSCSQSCCQQNPYQAAQMMAPPMPMAGACPQFPGCAAQCAPRCQASCCQQQQGMMMPPPMMAAPMQSACPQFPGCGAQCAPRCQASCCQQQQGMMMPPPMMAAPMMPMQSACPQFPSCAAQCAPRCQASCCQQNQMPAPMMPMAGGCPMMPGCSASCAPQCSQQCCQQNQQAQIPQQQLIIQQAPVVLQPLGMGSCPIFPGCSQACAPACRASCCTNGMMARTMGKKRSKVSHHKLHKKSKLFKKSE